MTVNKRYYWLKLHENFFNQANIRYLRTLPDGDTIVIIYLELLCMSLSQDGYVRTCGLYPTIDEEIALILNEDVMKVRLSLQAMKAANLISTGEGVGEFVMREFPALVGSETASTRRSRMLRERKKTALPGVAMQRQCNTDATAGSANAANCNVEKEIDKETDTEYATILRWARQDEGNGMVSEEPRYVITEGESY